MHHRWRRFVLHVIHAHKPIWVRIETLLLTVLHVINMTAEGVAVRDEEDRASDGIFGELGLLEGVNLDNGAAVSATTSSAKADEARSRVWPPKANRVFELAIISNFLNIIFSPPPLS
ncbi:hypothetical protein ACFX2J_000626 [Malus domestica]